jgi:hypothetical protein
MQAESNDLPLWAANESGLTWRLGRTYHYTDYHCSNLKVFE